MHHGITLQYIKGLAYLKEDTKRGESETHVGNVLALICQSPPGATNLKSKIGSILQTAI